MESNSESTDPVRKTYSCNICDRTFNRLHRLQSHIRAHTNRKNACSAANPPLKVNSEALLSPKHKYKCVTEVSKLIGNAIAHKKRLELKKQSMSTVSVSEDLPLNVTENHKKDNNSFSSLFAENGSNTQKSSTALQNPLQHMELQQPNLTDLPVEINSLSYQDPFNNKEKVVFEIIPTLPAADAPQSISNVNKTISTSIEKEELNTKVLLEQNTEDFHESTNPSPVPVESTPVLLPPDPISDFEKEIVIKTEIIDDEEEATNEAECGKTARRSKVLYSCDVCQMMFTNKCHLARHTLTHTKQKPHVCKVCFKGFTQIGNLNVHYRNHIAQNQANQNASHSQPQPVVNNEAPPQFRKIRLVSKQKSTYVCDVCGREFSNKCYLERHSFTHSKEKPHVCTVCLKGFAQVGNLNVHYLTHTNLKTFVCHVCDKAFTLMGSLKAHLHTHAEQKPFKCEVCGKGFSNKCFLRRHFLTHTDEKPYVCSVCHKGFVQVGNLNVHFLTHTKEKDFKCELCNKSFSRKLYLQKHYKQHISENDSVS